LVNKLVSLSDHPSSVILERFARDSITSYRNYGKELRL
jgi:hypothetical protein